MCIKGRARDIFSRICQAKEEGVWWNMISVRRVMLDERVWNRRIPAFSIFSEAQLQMRAHKGASKDPRSS